MIKKLKKIVQVSSCLLISFFSNESLAQDKKIVTNNPVRDMLQPLSPGAVKIEGHIGEKIDQCIHNRIKVQQLDNLVELFQTKELDPSGYRGEFIGKWAAAAGLAYRYQPDAELEKKMSHAMADLINSRSPEGYLSTYKKDNELKVWDVWIQKYVLLGLIAQFDLTANKEYLLAAQRSADHLINLTGPAKLSLEEYGPAIHKGGVNYSILEPIVLLYERTGEKKYLNYANYIVDSWSKPSKYTEKGVRLIENAEAGIPLVDYDVTHSYTLMSDFEGLCELYRVTGKKRYLDACIKAAEAIKKYELMIIGSVSNHEMWYNGAFVQTEMLEQPNETCATATWMKLCYQLLRLTGDARWADELEISLYNGLLGSMMPKGEWWAYNSLLNGERVPSRVQGVNTSCCVSSGPRGLLITPEWATMNGIEGAIVVNLYTAGNSNFALPKGEKVRIIQETDYPVTNLVTFTIQPGEPVTFPLKLRIPAWSKQTVLRVNDKSIPVRAGSYAVIERIWKPGDKVTLELDLRGRIISAPGSVSQQAVMRGPVVLALDNRLVQSVDTTVWLIAHPLAYENLTIYKNYKGYILPKYNFPKRPEDAYIDLKPIFPADKNIWMAFEVPFIVRGTHFMAHREKKIIMCDYASAGNQWNENNLYRVWLPQPLFMGNMFTVNTWKLLNYGAKQRSVVPDYIQTAIK